MTGQTRLGLSLSSFCRPEDFKNLKLNSFSYRGDWLYGFGWDENKFQNINLHRTTLDQHYPDRPVFWVRADGHSSWLNTEALKRVGFMDANSEIFKSYKDYIPLGNDGLTTGVLKEAAHMFVYTKLPASEAAQTKDFLLEGLQVFREAGFTHLRDMTSSFEQLALARELEQSQQLQMHIEHNFVFENEMDLSKLVREVVKQKQMDTKFLKSRGIKFFYDGSLGSETALLSRPYPSGKSGILGFSDQQVREIITESWKAGLDVSVHIIGDEAAHRIVHLAREVSAKGLLGRIHLEHVQVLRPETILMMKSLHVHCHLQPCHWLSDRAWLKEKLGTLYEYSFPWEALRRAQIPFSFGSDSPIEPASLFSNLQALQLSSKSGIPSLKLQDLTSPHVYPHRDSFETETHFENESVKKIIFL